VRRPVQILAILVCALALLAGCRSTPWPGPANFNEPGWTLRQGEAVWQRDEKQPGVAGELLVAMHLDGRSVIEFSKAPLPLVTARRTTNFWRIEFMGGRRARAGRGLPSPRFLWLHLPDAIAGRRSDDWQFEARPEGRWQFLGVGTTERIEGILDVTARPAFHTVRRGDTFHELCRWYGMKLDDLMAINRPLEQGRFKPGERLRLPPAP
jgi:hypothetical protein